MKINEMIRQGRKEQGLTQEQMAEYLGVSAPAVNKWEKGSSYPDITLLPALARLLKTDLNRLLCFHEELTDREIGEFLNSLTVTIQKDGYERGLLLAEEKLREYPSCEKLLLSVGLTLEGAAFVYPENTSGEKEPEKAQRESEKKEELQKKIEGFYERAAQSSDREIKNQADTMLINRYMERKEYEKAQRLLDTFMKKPANWHQLQSKLWLMQGETKKAQELLEGWIMTEITNISGMLITLMETAQQERDEERADFLAELSQQTARLYGLSELSAYTAPYGLAFLRKDKENCKKNLLLMLEAMEKPWNLNEFELYRHIEIKKEGAMSMKTMLPRILEELKRDKELDFLREDKEFNEILHKFTKNT